MELVVLVLEVILLVVKMKLSPEEATRTTAERYGVSFSTLWKAVSKFCK